MKKVVVLLPTYNEKLNLELFVDSVLAQEKSIPGYNLEVLIVDSHSTDGTWDVAQEIVKKNKKVHAIQVGPGLGVALIEGHRWSLTNLHPDVLAQMDADGQVDSDVLPRMVKAIDDGYEFVQGSRFVMGGKNDLSLTRRIFSAGSSWVCRILMGPWKMKEFTNSARAFTPALFAKMNIERIPWREKTFIVQPAFLHEAILAGAKYVEVPLYFKNRAEGYSKNKTVNYTIDVISYALEARFRAWGLNVPVYKLARKSKLLVKFGIVGFSGTVVDFFFYKVFINYLSLTPATAKGFSTEIAIVNNFLLNNFWTFKSRKTKSNIYQRFAVFNIVSLGGLFMSVAIIKFLHLTYGDGSWQIGNLKIAYNNFFFFATVPPVMIWNFTVNHFVTWRNKK